MKMLLTILTIMLAFNSQLNEKKNIAKAYSLCVEDTNVSTGLYKGDRILKGQEYVRILLLEKWKISRM